MGKWAHGMWRTALAGIRGVLAHKHTQKALNISERWDPLQQQRRRSAQGAHPATARGEAQCNQSRRGAPWGEVNPAPAPKHFSISESGQALPGFP